MPSPSDNPAPATAAATSGRPNVIWIFGDQHRAQALSCMGDPNLSTPNLDRMAAMGVHFNQAVAGMPLCCPFRGSLLTSLYPHQCVPGHEYPLPENQPTVASALNQAGYHTAYFGKWHLAGWHERDGRGALHVTNPDRRGDFQQWVGYENNNSQWDCWVHGGRGADAFQHRLPGYETDCLTDLLIDYLRGRAGQSAGASADVLQRATAKESAQPPTPAVSPVSPVSPGSTESPVSPPAESAQPFFAVLSVQPPHDPYVAPPQQMARHRPADLQMRPNVPQVAAVQQRARRELAGACAQIENLDHNVGRVLDALENLGLMQNTYIFFFSDHGDMHGSHGQFRKMTAYEESIRIPLIVYGPTPFYDLASGRNGTPLNHVDIAPTTIGLCNVPVPDWMQGSDVSHLLRRSTAARGGPVPDSAYLQLVVPTGHGDSVDRPWRGLVTGDGWKYVCLENQPWLLFNLNDDPYEQVNLALNSRYRSQRKRLHDRLAQWIAETGDSFPLPQL